MSDATSKQEPHDLIVMDRKVITDMISSWRRYTRIMTALVAVALVAVVFTQVQIRATQKTNSPIVAETSDNVHDIKRILELVDGVASPAAIEQQQVALREAIQSIGCDNRAALQDLLDQLIERGILAPGDATIECDTHTPAAGTTTTTPEGN